MSVVWDTNESSRSLIRTRPLRRPRPFAFSGLGRRNMPSRTLTPDPPTAPGQRTPPETLAAPGQRTPPETLAAPGQRTPPESPAFSGLRLVPVPGAWPPYDCETHGAACPAAREAATTNAHARQAPGHAGPPGPAGLAAPPAAPGHNRTAAAPAPAAAVAPVAAVAPAAAAAPADAAGRADAVAPVAAAGRADAAPGAAGPATALPRQFAQVLVEILAGSRPLRQTVGWTTDRVRAQIGELTQLLASDQRPRIRRIVTSQPAVSVVEMTVVVGFGVRSRALAMRFEHVPARQPAPGRPARPARWLCTEIETG
jgi:Family of unknown function (DUF6459)